MKGGCLVNSHIREKGDVIMLSNSSWPALILSYPNVSEVKERCGHSEVLHILKSEYHCAFLTADSLSEAWEIFEKRKDLGCIIIFCGGFPKERCERRVSEQFFQRSCASDRLFDEGNIGNDTKKCAGADRNPFGDKIGDFVKRVSRENGKIPVILLSDDGRDASGRDEIRGIFGASSDRFKEAARHIVQQLQEYIRFVLPDFFENLAAYTEKNKYAWHTPGHMGGAGFLRAPSGTAFYKYYGENALRSDLSVSVSELGSLLDHSGVTGEAERNSARVFGADQTYYVLNGTSASNQIIWSSQVTENDAALLDRNCHKSLNYAMIRTKALPIYMIPRRSRYGMIGPVRLSEFTEKSITDKIKKSPFFAENIGTFPISMMALTNSTYDGLCYNVKRILSVLSERIQRVHFDEAWFAYAAFHPIYRDFYGLTDIGKSGGKEGCGKKDDDEKEWKREDCAEEVSVSRAPLIFCSQSTHKLLTALSQSSMLHIRNGSELTADPAAFNETYMMYASTSPQYSMIASLDVATKMMQDQGFSLNHRVILDAVEIRRRIARIYRRTRKKNAALSGGDTAESARDKTREKNAALSGGGTAELTGEKSRGCDWFFRVWQPEWVNVRGQRMRFEDADAEYLASHQEPWILSAEDDWHGFENIEEDYVMLDPIKLTIMTPGIAQDGSLEDDGIPALIVSRFLAEYHVVCEKADYYSFLMLNSIGTDASKQDALLAAMDAFCTAYEKNRPIAEVLPKLSESFPKNYGSIGLADHCRTMHRFFRKNDMLKTMQLACAKVPEPIMPPSKAYENIVRNNVERVELKNASGRTAAAMIVPYPPGIPLIMGGEILAEDQPVYRYLKLLEDFENSFPGYEMEIHGIQKKRKNGRTQFFLLCVKDAVSLGNNAKM